MNIIKRELKANLKSLIIWMISLVLIAYAASFEFEAFVGNPEILEALASFEQMFVMFGIEITDLATPEGFLSVVSLYFYIPLAIYAGLLGSSIIAKEERDKTAEYLFTLPIKREQVLISKLIVAVAYICLITIGLAVGIVVSYLRFETTEAFYQFVLFMSFGLMMTQLIFMSLGMFLAAILKDYKKSGALTLGYVLGSYLLFILIGLTDKIAFLRFFTPFKYFEVSDMIKGTIRIEYLMLSVILIGLCVFGLFKFYKKRDLYI